MMTVCLRVDVGCRVSTNVTWRSLAIFPSSLEIWILQRPGEYDVLLCQLPAFTRAPVGTLRSCLMKMGPVSFLGDRDSSLRLEMNPTWVHDQVCIEVQQVMNLKEWIETQVRRRQWQQNDMTWLPPRRPGQNEESGTPWCVKVYRLWQLAETDQGKQMGLLACQMLPVDRRNIRSQAQCTPWQPLFGWRKRGSSPGHDEHQRPWSVDGT